MNTSKPGGHGFCLTPHIFISLVFISLVFISPQIFAQPCEDAECMGEEIMAAATLMTNAACDSASIARSDRSGFFTTSVTSNLENACTRSKNWLKASHRKDDFVKIGKRKRSECYIAERLDDGIGNDDGICTRDEKGTKKDSLFGCIEADGGGDGNEICEITPSSGKGNKMVWEKCLEICDETDPDYDDEVDDITTMKLMAGAMHDAASDLDRSNSMMLQQLAVLNEAKAISQELNDPGIGTPMTCKNVTRVEVNGYTYSYGNRNDDYTSLAAIIGVARGLEGGVATCDEASDTTIFGADFLAVCIPLSLTAMAETIIADEMELLDDTITATRIDNVAMCAEYLGEKLEGMDAKLDEIIDLLNTPQGQRPEFPKKD